MSQHNTVGFIVINNACMLQVPSEAWKKEFPNPAARKSIVTFEWVPLVLSSIFSEYLYALNLGNL